MRRFVRIAASVLAAILAVLIVVVVLVDTDPGHRLVADRINGLRPENGLRFTVGRIDGSLYGRAILRDVRVRDADGLVFSAARADLDWTPVAWLRNRLDITALRIPVATLHKLPRTLPTRRPAPILPEFEVRIGRLAVDRLMVAPAVTGRVRQGRVEGFADIRAGRAKIALDLTVAGSDRAVVRIDAQPAANRLDIAARVRGTAGGVLSRLAGASRGVALDVDGDGVWRQWRGQASAALGGRRVADLALGVDAGAYTLTGVLTPAAVATGKLQRITTPRVLVNGAARFAGRRIAGHVSLRAPALAAEAAGTIDLGQAAWRDLRLRLRLLRPAAFLPKLSGRSIELRAILDGPFRTARYDYRLSALRFAIDDTGFEGARAGGHGRLGGRPFVLPVRFVAQRVTGVGNVAGGILRNLTIDGGLRVSGRIVTGQALRLRSDKLDGRIALRLDLSNGRYQVGLEGGLRRYLVPGLGVVDVTSQLSVTPNPGPGNRITGTGIARVVRLDNAFFRALTGGLPVIRTGLIRDVDKVLHFRGLVLTSPLLRVSGNGYRRRDGTFHFEGSGRQATYGAVTLRLDGDIARPRIELLLPAPNAVLGLSGVRMRLDPVAEGYRVIASGGSRAGPFTAAGRILLPRGGPASIDIAGLDVSGTRVSGQLGIVPGGFPGQLSVDGGGLRGRLDLAPVGDVQRIAGRIDAVAARLGSGIAVRRGRTDFTILLDPAGTRTEATASGAGLRVAGLTLARFAGTTRLVDGVGEVRASIAGTRGRGFDIATVTQITKDGFRIAGSGTIDRRPIALAAPVMVTREGDAWRIAPARITLAGGEVALSGRVGGSGSAIEATLARLPLSVLDIGYPGLGLGGVASGRISYAGTAGAAPTGRVDLTVRGLSRSGLIQSSRPIDMGVAGRLSADRAAMRAVMASGGTTIGRGQAVLTLPAGEDLATRVAGAGVFAQLRYTGPADTLWRLTGVELFDLSGPVGIAADVTGRVAAPQIRGVVRANGARIESATTGTVLTDVQAGGRFAGSRLAIDRFAAVAGRGGRVTGTGRFDFAAANGLGLDLAIQAENAALIARDDIAARVTGPLTFRSDGRGGTIAGNVRLDASRYRLGQATAAAAVPRISVREINLPEGGGDEAAPRAPWQLDIAARAPGNLQVSGLGLTSEWSATLKIAGQPDNPAITGRADLIRGDYEFAGREFELSRGVIRFAGEVPANPALDIEANADSQGLNASIRVTGVAQKPEITFASTPALPQDELLSRLLFGTAITNLSAPEALQLAAAVAALQDGGNGLNPINAVRRAAGLDRLRILPADPQTGQGTSIAAGKYVTRRLYAEIVSDGQGYSATRVEYQVTRWLSLLSSISTLGRQSANVRVSRDY